MEKYIPYIIDGVLILYLILRFVKGYKKGFVREIFSLVFMAGFVALLVLYLNPLRTLVAKYLTIAKWVGETKNIWINYLLALSEYAIITFIIFIAFSLICRFISWLVRKMVRRWRDDHPAFAAFDRSMGFLLGLVNGVLTIVVVSYVLFQPLFFPKQQKYFQETQFLSAVYHTTEDIIVDVTGKDTDQVSDMVISYLLGEESEEEMSEFQLQALALLLKDLPTLIKDPASSFQVTGDMSLVIGNYIFKLSALADLTAKVPENELLQTRFGTIYDLLVSYIPEGYQVVFEESNYEAMFNEETGSFFQVGLSQDQLDKLLNICSKASN